MKNILKKALIQIKPEYYLSLLILIAPLLNFLVGINIDLYASSLPNIAQYYHVSIMTVNNTITVTMVGFSIGCILFGALLDSFGRRRIILLGLTIYILASFSALFCKSIQQRILIRFIQGMMSAVVSIGPRALIVDNFSGHRLTIALLYTSLAYSVGPIVGPFIGGLLQYHFGWKANFAAYTFFALVLTLIFTFYVNESHSHRQPFSFKKMFTDYINTLKNGSFIAGILIASGVQIEQMLYPTVGPFLIENKLHQTAIIYGNTALIIGTSALLGTLTNRIFIKKFNSHTLMTFGFIFIFLGILLQTIFHFTGEMSVNTLIFPFILILFGNGFLFVNILTHCLKLFPYNVGVASAALICLSMLIAGTGLLIISKFNINNLLSLAIISGAILTIQLMIFYMTFKPSMQLK